MSQNILKLLSVVGIAVSSVAVLAQGTLTVDDLRNKVETHYSTGTNAYICSVFDMLHSNPQTVKRVVDANRRGDVEFECEPLPGKKEAGFITFISRLGEIRENKVSL